MSSDSIKVLIAGHAGGKLKDLLKKVATLHSGKSGPFHCLFIIHALETKQTLAKLSQDFSDDDSVPLPTYFVDRVNDSEQGDMVEINSKFTYLGKNGIATINGLRVAYLAENGDADALLSEYKKHFGGAQTNGVDLFLSNQWPTGILNFLKAEDVPHPESTSDAAAKVANVIKPRYHFVSSENIFFERIPYKNEKDTVVTRFISLGHAMNTKDQKYIHALNLVPVTKQAPPSLPPNTTSTENPYSKNKRAAEEAQQPQKKQKAEATPQTNIQKKMEESPRNRNNTNLNADGSHRSCWFCLTNHHVEKHLVVTVGPQHYIALAKGGLFPDHCLIVLIHHKRLQSDLNQNEKDELGKWKASLIKHFKAEKKVPIFFTTNPVTRAHHFHVQVLPVAESQVDAVIETLQKEAARMRFEFEDVTITNNEVPTPTEDANFICFEIGDTTLYHSIREDRFPLGFLRETVCLALGLKGQEDWRTCIKPREEETEMAASFRKTFHPSDVVNAESVAKHKKK